MSQKSSANSPVGTRGRKGSSSKEVFSLAEVTSLIKDVEQRIKACFREEIADLKDKLTSFECQISAINSECGRLGDELKNVKSVIVNQQLVIESHERKLRANNLIVHNIPEGVFRVGSSEMYNDDRSKINLVIDSANVDVRHEDIISCRRLGRIRSDKIRPIKIVLKSTEKKFEFLNKRKDITNSDKLLGLFHNKVYVNPDSSILVRNEEHRLRHHLKVLKNSQPNSASFIRSGVLYLDGEPCDKVDIKNQIF